MEKNIASLVQSVEKNFRAVCNKMGYDLHEEEETGVLDSIFWTWLTEFCLTVSEGAGEIAFSSVLTSTAMAFATSLDSRIMLMETYAMKLMMEIEAKA